MATFSSARSVAGRSAPMPPARSVRAWPDDPIVIPGRGLQFPRQLPFQRWISIGRQLSEICSSTAWCLGDWLIYGEVSYHSRYREAIEQTSLDYQTLRNYAWVAKRFPLSRRRDTLSFGHHAEVTALAEAEQDFWLRKAEELAWSVKQLRSEVRASLKERSVKDDGRIQPGSNERSGHSTIRLSIHVSSGQLEHCRAAAQRAGLSVDEWVVLALEQAARLALALCA
jgi:predicted HicB family RNase H-like nuclease